MNSQLIHYIHANDEKHNIFNTFTTSETKFSLDKTLLNLFDKFNN